MAKYRCGNRECTDEELDIVEKLRGGSLKAVDSKVGTQVDLSELRTSLEAVSPEKIALAVGQEISKRPVQLVDFQGFLKHEEACPECQAAHGKYIGDNLARFAEERGYKLEKVAAAPVQAEKPVEAKVEPKPETVTDEVEEELSFLDRVIPIKTKEK